MLILTCPWCGERDETEFHYAGEPRPRPSSAASDEEWSRYLFHRTNEKGPHRELWHHRAGCGRLFLVLRDSVSHRVLEVAKPGEHA